MSRGGGVGGDAAIGTLGPFFKAVVDDYDEWKWFQ